MRPSRPTSTVPSRTNPTPLGVVRRSDPELRRIVVRVRAWGLERGRACNSDALTTIVGVAVDEARTGCTSPRWWTSGRVEQVLTAGVSGFCAARELGLPPGLAPAMALWLDYLGAQGALGPGSEPLERLHLAVGVGRRRAVDRRRRATAGHPASGGRR